MAEAFSRLVRGCHIVASVGIPKKLVRRDNTLMQEVIENELQRKSIGVRERIETTTGRHQTLLL